MPWKEATSMSLRLEFVTLAETHEVSMRALCRRFQISPKTGYKWLHRFRTAGPAALQDRSRRPQHSPRHTSPVLEQAILALRAAHPVWGPRKLRACLPGDDARPSVSTVAAILHRHGCLDPAQSAAHRPCQRFAAAAPNHLWQMDFKGHVALSHGGRCHPLTVLDDHSRFLLALHACGDERWPTVQTHLITAFRRYGLPDRLLVDNGAPWGNDATHPHTPLTVWLLRLGIACSHARAYHPQTLGKDERLHRTLQAELLAHTRLVDLPAAQQALDGWRAVYNWERPHEALALAVPGNCYRPSPRAYPEQLPPIEYGAEHLVRRVQAKGEIWLHNRVFTVGNAFRGYPVGLRPTPPEGRYDVYFCQHRITTIDLAEAPMVQ